MSGLPRLRKWQRQLELHGVTPVELVFDRYDPQSFGNQLADFRWKSLIIRVLSDRNDEFLEVQAPDGSFLTIEILGVALGWGHVRDRMAARSPIPLEQEIQELATHAPVIEVALSRRNWKATKSAVARAEAEIGEVMEKWIKQIRRKAGFEGEPC